MIDEMKWPSSNAKNGGPVKFLSTTLVQVVCGYADHTRQHNDCVCNSHFGARSAKCNVKQSLFCLL